MAKYDPNQFIDAKVDHIGVRSSVQVRVYSPVSGSLIK